MGSKKCVKIVLQENVEAALCGVSGYTLLTVNMSFRLLNDLSPRVPKRLRFITHFGFQLYPTGSFNIPTYAEPQAFHLKCEE